MIMSHCDVPRSTPQKLDLAVLQDLGYEFLDAKTAAQPEVYGYDAWGQYSAWGVGTIRSLDVQRQRDTLGASADAFGTASPTNLVDSELSGLVTWVGSLLGADLGQAMLRPVVGDAQLAVNLSTLDGEANFSNLKVAVDGVSSDFRTPTLSYAVSVTDQGFADAQGRLQGDFFGPAHEEMAGTLDDRTANLMAGFGGRRPNSDYQ